MNILHSSLKHFGWAVGLLLTSFTPSPQAAAQGPLPPIQCVNPFVGTGGHGHTYPGATVPFGMVQVSPDTNVQNWDHCSGYNYSDNVIDGFSETHLVGTGVGDLGDIMLMPTVGAVQMDAGTPGNGYCSNFSHAQEHASPGYYSVFLQDPKVQVELTATARCGMQRYTFPASDASHVILDLAHGIQNSCYAGRLTVENDTTLSGYRSTHGWSNDRTVYFVIQFSQPFSSYEIAQGSQVFPAGTQTAQGDDLRASFNYRTNAGDVVIAKIGISATGIAGARENLTAEIPGFDFSAVLAAAQKKWSQALDTVQIETPDPAVRRTFYSNLYWSYVAPITFNDEDGSYLGMDQKVHPYAGFQNLTEMSIWDIYRTQVPLLTITQPSDVTNLVQSMLAEYQQNGLHTTPIWPLWGDETFCMVGYHSAPIITEAYLDGLAGPHAQALYAAMRDTAMQNRNGLASYKRLGYVASRPGEASASMTLDYAYDDWCNARMAQALGHPADAQMFFQRAASYRNEFDRTVRFIRAREADGEWHLPFADDTLDGYTEGDAWQYAFQAPQDMPGLIALYGGNAGFVRKMDNIFKQSSYFTPFIPDITAMTGQYSQGNEPDLQDLYLYDYAGQPWKTQMRVRQIAAADYNDAPGGEPGNIDCGEISSWYVLSAMGLYPVNPASNIYVIGSPTVSRLTIALNPKYYRHAVFTMIAEHNSPRNIYIQSATLNGKPLIKPWITNADIVDGGTLRFVMGSQPNKKWGSASADAPPATMPANFSYAPLPKPSLAISSAPVALPLPIHIACGDFNTPIEDFIPYPTFVDGSSNSSDSPVDINVPDAAPEGVYQHEWYGQNFTYRFPVPIGHSYTVRLHFAEIFDNGAGERVENVAINGVVVLPNFDIYKAAGGMNKAVVETFPNISPDARGDIDIHVSAAPNSPDQNAKISGIEILPQ